MEHKIKYLFLLIILVFQGCDYFEMRGFVAAYETVDERFDQSMKWNKSHPFKTISIYSEDYKIYAMGDAHLGTADNLNIFLHSAKNDHALAAVMVGDLSTGSVENYQFLQQNIPDPDSLLTFQLVGNHDLYFHGWLQFYKMFGSGIYYFTVKTPSAKDLYICLDSGGGTLGEKQFEWLNKLLQNHRNKYRHCVIFSHVNIFRIRNTLSANPYPGEVMALAQLCLEYNISMVINGHDHIQNVKQFGPTTFITMDALQDGLDNAGYTIISNVGNRLSYKNVNFN